MQQNAAIGNTLKTANQPIPIFNASLAVLPLYYTVKQAATIIGYDPGTIRNWISADERGIKPCPFESITKGSKRLILISSFHEYLERRDEDINLDDVEFQTKPRGRGRPRNIARGELCNE